MSKIRVIFLGTPEIAVACLKGLVEDTHFDVVGVITQPDRPAGRKMQLQPSPVKNFCLAHGLRVISPESVNTDSMLQQIEIWGAEIAVVVAFGQILGESFLKLFPLGAVNVHGSLLPRWRGAAPIQRAIEFGDQETGVALQKIVKKLDAGDVIGVRKIPISDETDAQRLYERMGQEGAELLQVELMDYIRGNLAGEPQDESQVTYARKIEKTEGEIDWSLSAPQISRKVRAFNMGPGTWSHLDKKKVKIHRTKIVVEQKSASIQNTPLLPGSIVRAEGSDLWVRTGKDGILAIIELQPESRNRMTAAEFIKGYSPKIGDQFMGAKDE